MARSDAGLVNERTALAWQRTALSLMAGSAIIARLAFDRLGWSALAAVVVAVPLSLWVAVESRGRYAHDAGIRARSRRRGGRAPTALAVATLVLILVELAAILRGLRG